MKKVLLTQLLILGALLAACANQPVEASQKIDLPTVSNSVASDLAVSPTVESPVAIPSPAAALSASEVLGNLSYTGIFPDGPITLTDGSYYYSEGGSGTPYVRLIDNLIIKGDINQDGVEDAVFLLEDNSEGSADFTLLGAVLNLWTDPKPVEVVQVEDRIAMKSFSLDGPRVIVEFIGHGQGDVDCCASRNVRQVFELKDGRITQTGREELGKASAADLINTSWRLVNPNGDQESVLPGTEITLNIQDGQISGSAGCNNYNSSITGDQALPNQFTVGPISTTQKACPDPVSNQELTYLTRLGTVDRWAYKFGNLVLFYPLEDNEFGELTFEPKEKDTIMTDQILTRSVADLQAAYGAPSQAGFGSAVFYESLQGAELEKAALAKYKYFVGDLWERYGEEAWMAPWKEVYTRQAGTQPDIVAELRNIQDPETAISVPMILENIEDAGKARAALSSVYDDPAVADLRVYTLGDGGAMSGILIAGAKKTGEAAFLVFLLD